MKIQLFTIRLGFVVEIAVIITVNKSWKHIKEAADSSKKTKETLLR